MPELISLCEPESLGINKGGRSGFFPPAPTVSESIMAVTQHQPAQWLRLFVYCIPVWSSESENECTHQGSSHLTGPWRKRRDVGPGSFSARSHEDQISEANLESGSCPGERVLQRYSTSFLEVEVSQTLPLVLVLISLCLVMFLMFGCWLAKPQASQPPGPAGPNPYLISVKFEGTAELSSLLLCCFHKSCPPARASAVSKWALTQILLMSPSAL